MASMNARAKRPSAVARLGRASSRNGPLRAGGGLADCSQGQDQADALRWRRQDFCFHLT